MSRQQQIREAETLLAAYGQAELMITRLVADAVARGRLGTVDHYRRQQMELQRLLRRTKAVLDALEARAATEVFEEIQSEYTREYMQAIGAGSSPVAVPESAIQALAMETGAAVATANASILRSTADVYREITKKVLIRSLTSGEAHTKTLQSALNEFADRGVTTLTDAAGRRWNMQTYADMAVRTGKSRARMEGRIRGYSDAGVDLVLVSTHPACAPQCQPFQGRVLSLSGPAGRREVAKPDGSTATVDVVANIRDAIARGYHHPNAILGGEQTFRALGGTLAGSVGTYRGPAVSITTAQGNKMTVSPKHPVLTHRGWITAETVRKGDTVFSTSPVDGGTSGSGVGANVDDVPTTVEQEFVALKKVLPCRVAPTAGHHFDDDRQFLEGEVYVVVPDHGLPVVPDTHVIEETGEVRFVGAGVECPRGPSDGSEPFGSFGIRSTVGRSLPDLDSGFNQSAPERRVGDSEDVGEVLAGISGLVHTDEIVDVNMFSYHGKAFDFQTGDGIYVLNGIITHNCRHRETAYTPGMRIPRVPEQDPKEYEALQRQRQIERHIRRWKRREAVALTPEEAAYAKARVRVWQKAQREHVAAWPGVLQRRYDREKVYRGAAGVTPKFTPKKEGTPEWLSPPPHVVKGSPLQQTVEAFLSKRQDNLGPSTHVTWGGVKRIAPDPDPRHVNPNYAEARAVGDKGWMHNCVRCTSAWELRRRGADVQAGYGTYWNDHTLRIDQELDKIHGPFVLGRYHLPWQNVTTWVDDQGRTRKPYWYERPNAKTRTKKDNQRTLETFQDSVPDGATGYAIGVWSGRGSGGHIWNWEKKEGRIMFIDAQNGSEHFDPSVYMNYLRGGSLMIGRLDDMIPDVTTLHVIGDMNGGKRYVK